MPYEMDESLEMELEREFRALRVFRILWVDRLTSLFREHRPYG